ncbi:hypothetical protein EDD85DRAFT_813163 [Armillaria nabsnona]|nr:hypothetical protein EDD85DRAFT_813163 [Armillaria nabsnona]
MPSKTPMNPSSASRIQSTQAKTGSAGKNTFASRAQSAGQTNANKGLAGGGTPKNASGAGAGGGTKSPKSK